MSFEVVNQHHEIRIGHSEIEPLQMMTDGDVEAFSPHALDMFTDSSLADFLNDIMLPSTLMPEGQPLAEGPASHGHAQRDFLDFGTSWIDFADIDTLLEDPDTQAEPKTSTVTVQIPPSGTKTPLFDQSYGSRSAAFSRSVWRWTPSGKDYGGAEQLNLSLPSPYIDSPETRLAESHLLSDQRIDQTMRDKMLALILSTCDKSVYPEVVSAFPSADLLNRLMHHYLNTHFLQMDSWLHVPTFVIEDQELELVISTIAAGAVINSISAIRKLGFAIQEAVKDAIARKVCHVMLRGSVPAKHS